MQEPYDRASVLKKEVNLSFLTINGVGGAPETVARAFAQEVGAVSEPFADESGVVVLKVVNREDASEIADYSQYTSQIQADRGGQNLPQFAEKVHKATTEVSDTENYLHKHY
ncbi:MAG: hypothetical protein AAF740_05925 [Bacteroidota bacterium]